VIKSGERIRRQREGRDGRIGNLRTLRENRDDGDGVKNQRGDGSDPRAEKNADGEQAEDDASDGNNKAVVGVALGGGRHKVNNQG
jgi:hypothetical protein